MRFPSTLPFVRRLPAARFLMIARHLATAPHLPTARFLRVARLLPVAAVLTLTAACAGVTESEPPPPPAMEEEGPDPRIDLAAGFEDAEIAASNMELVAQRPRPEGFFDTGNPGNILYANSDMGYQGDHLFLGSFRGFQVFDISDPSSPELLSAVLCPGGQGDVSVYGDLLFMSVEMPNGRIDCGEQGTSQQAVDPERFRGVRIFDISDVRSPRQVAAVQTCRGSHTHTLLPAEDDPEHVYVYVQGTSGVRPAAELEGCVGAPPEEDPETAFFRIEVIRVPIARPQDAEIVNMPRIFADPETGDIAGLWQGGAAEEGAQSTATTNQCHDITAYPDIGLAGGACAGNGILLDIRDPANPKRVEEVFDPNFAYWHSATFDNEGSKVIFTDEWGGGLGARCRSSDPGNWGANAIFTLHDDDLALKSYYKLPVPQGETENCVAHNGSLVPVPGRDIMVQSWYQGGISVFDFTDPEHPFEIAYFDRGPLSADQLLLGGTWSAYWYNGRIYSSEIARGLDVLRLTPSEHLSANEIAAAELVRQERFNPQTQQRIEWPAEPAVARAYLDQLGRSDRVGSDRVRELAAGLERALGMSGMDRSRGLRSLADEAERLGARASGQDARRLGLLAETLRGMAGGGAGAHGADVHDIGEVDFRVSCAEGVRHDFDRAVALLHHMMYEESRAAFEEVAAEDPGCAMAHWGVAVTHFQPLWPNRPGPEVRHRAWDAVERARALGPATARERDLVEAAAAFWENPDAEEWWPRIERWAAAMERAYRARPDDVETAAFYALSRLAAGQVAEDRIAHNAAAAGILGGIHERHPEHPGAIHYTIHANDVTGRAGESPEVVRSYDDIAPSVPHALHMPSHIYVREGDWPEVIEWNRRSADAALDHPAGDRVSHHYLHAIDYLVYAHLQRGEDARAREAMEEGLSRGPHQETFIAAYHLASIPARYAVERRAWEGAAALDPATPADRPWDRYPWPEGLGWFARGLGAAHTGDLARARAAEDRLVELREAAEAAGERGFATYIEIDRLILSGLLAEAAGDAGSAVERMREATRLEGTVEKHPVTPGAVLPPWEALGDLLLRLDRPAEALDAFEASLEIWPGRYHSLLGAARAARSADDGVRSAAYYRELLEMVGESERPGVAEAREAVGHRTTR